MDGMNAAALAAQRVVKNNQVPHNVVLRPSTSVARKTPMTDNTNPMTTPQIWDGSTSQNAANFPGLTPVDATSAAPVGLTGNAAQQAIIAAMKAKVAGTYFGPNTLRTNR